jgi:hypothetical protein
MTVIETRLAELDPTTVVMLMRLSLASDTAKLLDWRYVPLGIPTGQMTGGVYRVMGNAQDQSKEVDWSLVLKVVSCPHGEGAAMFKDVTHPLYWKREVLAFQSGLLDHLAGGLEAPRCFSIDEQPDGSYWLWLEDVRDSHSRCWPLGQFARTAYTLGRFNGAYLAGEPLPDYPWLVRSGTPRGILDHNTSILDGVQDPETWKHPLLRAAFPIPIADRLVRLWEDRAVLLNALDRLPHTLCHLDAWRGNFFAPQQPKSEERLVAIDWAFPGLGAVGIDAGDLFAPGFGMCAVEPCEPGTLDSIVFENYLEGLREEGWPGDRRLVRFVFTAFSATKYGCFIPWLADAHDKSKYAIWEQVSGQPMAEFLRNQGVLIYYLLDLADEARALLEEERW